jgi:hypothetical protein
VFDGAQYELMPADVSADDAAPLLRPSTWDRRWRSQAELLLATVELTDRITDRQGRPER